MCWWSYFQGQSINDPARNHATQMSFVIVGRTRLAEILQVPWELLASLDVQFRMTTAS
jgi:hypothetical protein